MGRKPCCEEGVRRGAWSAEEDQRLVAYIQQNGHHNWRALPKQAGLLRCGKSCRLRWINYLRPDLKRGNFTADEEDLIIRLHQELGNRWAAIAAQLPGRTDNEIKNVWHTIIKKKKLEDADSGGRKKQALESKPAKNAKQAADVHGDAPSPLTAASPGLSSSVSSGVTCSTVTESTAAAASADNAAITSASQLGVKADEIENFSTAKFPPIDESFWTSADVMDMDLGAMDEELGLPSLESAMDEDMDFWLNMLVESGDMTDLSVM